MAVSRDLIHARPISQPRAKETKLGPGGSNIALVLSVLDIHEGESEVPLGCLLTNTISTPLSVYVCLAKFRTDTLLHRFICSTSIMK